MRTEPADDDTIRVRPPPVRARRSGIALGIGLLAVLASGSTGWLLWPRTPAFVVQSATEAAIRDHAGDGLTVLRLAQNPRILVLDFSSLRQQGLMLNRVAAFVEKRGQPHDRVLSDAELAQAIRNDGATIATYYYGHDYPAPALARFFATADRDHVQLDPEEERLRALLRQQGWLAPETEAGVISIPRVGADASVTASARATILHHELSHGEFFSDPAYASYVRGFWATALTAPERAHIAGWLASEGYDPALEQVMLNERQAYLMFTPDPDYFTPAAVGLTPQRLADLRAAFLRGMPAGWLRDSLARSVAGQ
jgi:hypothetical protein